MKIWPIAAILTTQLFYSTLSTANEAINNVDEAQTMPFVNEIPTDEKAFVEVINKFDKQKIKVFEKTRSKIKHRHTYRPCA